MALSNDIVLRPRFKVEIAESNDKALKAFEEIKKKQKDFVISRVDDHVFIRLPRNKQHFWSPQLHLEINEKDNNSSWLHGLYGPNPTVWTMFMFLHFLVAGLFMVFGIWAYTNWTLKDSYQLQLILMGLMVLLWFVLYAAGRLGKRKGKKEMELLCDFMKDTLSLD